MKTKGRKTTSFERKYKDDKAWKHHLKEWEDFLWRDWDEHMLRSYPFGYEGRY